MNGFGALRFGLLRLTGKVSDVIRSCVTGEREMVSRLVQISILSFSCLPLCEAARPGGNRQIRQGAHDRADAG